ncbi:MAG TPA: hypothetical protein PLL01_17375, partial [Rhodoferax sp.]|nr:hypothetical protein [Rhodoferax sp.]
VAQRESLNRFGHSVGMDMTEPKIAWLSIQFKREICSDFCQRNCPRTVDQQGQMGIRQPA